MLRRPVEITARKQTLNGSRSEAPAQLPLTAWRVALKSFTLRRSQDGTQNTNSMQATSIDLALSSSNLPMAASFYADPRQTHTMSSSMRGGGSKSGEPLSTPPQAVAGGFLPWRLNGFGLSPGPLGTTRPRLAGVRPNSENHRRSCVHAEADTSKPLSLSSTISP